MGSGNPRACSEEHALLAVRRARGLAEEPPKRVGTGQWLFFERQRLGITRSDLALRLGTHTTDIWTSEVNNRELPPDWTALLQTPGFSKHSLLDWLRGVATPPPASESVQGGVMTPDSDRLIQIMREMNRVQGELVAETRKYDELVKDHVQRFQVLEARSQMLMGVAFAVTGERVAAERHMAHALLRCPNVPTEFALYWPESKSALEAARTWTSSAQSQVGDLKTGLDEMSKRLVDAMQRIVAAGMKPNA